MEEFTGRFSLRKLTNAKADKFYRFVPHNGLEGGYRTMQSAMDAC